MAGGCAPRGTGYPCHCGARRRACFVCRPPTMPLPSFLPPIPPPALAERSSPAGKGEPQSLFRRGLRPRHPCIKPFAAPTATAKRTPCGDESARHWLSLPLWCPAGWFSPCGTGSPCRCGKRNGGLPRAALVIPAPGERTISNAEVPLPRSPLSLAAGTANRKAVLTVLRQTGDAEGTLPLGTGLAGRASAHGFSRGDARGEAPCMK